MDTHMAPLKIEHIPLAVIQRSPTNPRKRFDPDGLKELAASIKAQGILEPILLRPIPPAIKAGNGIQYELVAGERRWRAARLAGIEHAPSLVRDLPDDQVLEIQLTENLQRQDLDPLEEAAGYRQLMALKKINAEALAELIGKSRAYVYTRTKLTDLCPEARKALEEGQLDASRALLIARIGHHDTQRQALKAILQGQWRGDEPMSYRDAHRHIQEHYMLALKAAPFDPRDAGLLPKAGACTACPKRTGNQPDLFGDIKSADVCTDPRCFAGKRAAHWDNVRKAAEAKGKTVITGADARKIFPHPHGDAQAGYQSLDQTCWDDPRQRKVRDIIGKDSGAIELVQHPARGDIVEVVRTTALTEALNAKGVKTRMQKVAKATGRTGSGAPSTATLEKRERREEIDELFRARLLQAVHDKHPDKLTRDHLLRLARYFTQYEADVLAVAKLHGYTSRSALEQKFKAMTPAKLVAVVLDLYVSDCAQTTGNLDALIDMADAYKIDHKAVEKKIRDDFARLDAEKKAREKAADAAASKKVKTAATAQKQAKSPTNKTAAKKAKK
jgi:ParB/RepB/Spo0J family partition protein